MFALAQVAGRFEAGANRVLAPLGQPPEQPSAPPHELPLAGAFLSKGVSRGRIRSIQTRH
jgi:hypothetical protein